MTKARVYFDGRFIMELTSYTPLYTPPKLYVVKCRLTNYLVSINGKPSLVTFDAWRVCGDEYSYTAIFPTEEAAEIFINAPIMYGGLAFTNTKEVAE